MSVLIVGASVAGIGTARALRSHGYDESIAILDEELHTPYDKPPLSKEMLAAGGRREPAALISPEELATLGIALRLGVRAVRLDASARVVVTDDGEAVPFTDLVIATGVRARTLPLPTPAGVYTLRSLDDADTIRAELERASRLVIIGAGFIGAELASAARLHGVDVVVLEAQPTPMAHLFGDEVAGVLNSLHSINAVTVLAGVQVSGFLGSDRFTGAELADGRSIQGDFAVVAIGARPDTAWLESSGLVISDGIACDARLQALGTTGIYAAGDVARWPHGLYEADLRIEHWTNANEHAGIVAAAIMGEPAPAAQVPYVWSHQYGRFIQIVGQPRRGQPTITWGHIADGPFRAVYTDSAGLVVGAVSVDDPRTTMTCRKAIKKGTAVTALDFGQTIS
jgi:NADPH-dependent 2,4-dienoyl-CoA reductase/sulfur reductase-like enzyme